MLLVETQGAKLTLSAIPHYWHTLMNDCLEIEFVKQLTEDDSTIKGFFPFYQDSSCI